MVNMLKTGLAYLTSQLANYASELVTYARGTDSVVVPAVIGHKLLRIDDGMGGVKLEWTDIDCIIPADQLILAGQRITPIRGDLIVVSTDYNEQTFEVLPYGMDPPWRWSDPIGQTSIRVHAKNIDTQQFYY